ncbi:cobalamin-dependent protein [Candidatus Methylomirabilis sp.]|uniref:B12-binding domain-containing radical SAM protein n=1 Tax=Candidatus Methylomirabilis sp. TaxID=2032687 RepID=UPI002A5C35DC|nr:cobalamin-dependent protein [Candidatus Methylomirabilis sp.]
MSSQVGAAPKPLQTLFFLDYDDGLGGRFTNSPGLLPLIGHARAAGFDVTFVDAEERLFAALDDGLIDVVAISSMERLLPRSIQTAQRVRERRSDVVLMLGGSAIEAFALDLAASLFDVVVTGEGEHRFVPLLTAIAQSRGLLIPTPIPATIRLPAHQRDLGPAEPGGVLDANAVACIAAATFRRSAKRASHVSLDIGLGGVYLRAVDTGRVLLIEAPTRAQLADAIKRFDDEGTTLPPDVAATSLDATPLAEELDAFCIYPWDEVNTNRWSTLEFYTQRGCCWGRCEFCSVADRNIRAISHDRVLDVLREAAQHGIETVSFSDDLFVQDTAWNRRLLERLLPLHLGLKYRAQTMANRSVWPLLDLMRDVGFLELSFGVETLNGARARFMGKSYNGERYVEGATETITRVAEAGICPVLYLIMADPCSTLEEIAAELADVVDFVGMVYCRTGVVPKTSYSLAMLPVAGPAMTGRYRYSTTNVKVGDRVLRLPAEFHFAPLVSRYLRSVAATTDALPFRRENLGCFPIYLRIAREVAADAAAPEQAAVNAHVERGLCAFEALARELDRDIEWTARELAGEGSGRTLQCRDELRFEFARFGGYIAGVQRYHELLDAAAGAQ